MLYASECWTVGKADVLRIDALDQWCLRRILGFKWSDFVRNEDVRHATQQPPLSSIVKTRRLSLFGHIARMLAVSSSNHRQRSGGNLTDGHAIPGSGLLLTTWQNPTLGFRKQERQLRTGSTGGCLRSIAQRTRSGACSYWIGLVSGVKLTISAKDASQHNTYKLTDN